MSSSAAAASAGVGSCTAVSSPRSPFGFNTRSPSPPLARITTCTLRLSMLVTNSWCRLGRTGKPRLLDVNASFDTTTALTGSPIHRSSSVCGGSVGPRWRHTPSCGWPSHMARRLAHASNGSCVRRRVCGSTSEVNESGLMGRSDDASPASASIVSIPLASAASTAGSTSGTRTQSAVCESAPRNWLTILA